MLTAEFQAGFFSLIASPFIPGNEFDVPSRSSTCLALKNTILCPIMNHYKMVCSIFFPDWKWKQYLMESVTISTYFAFSVSSVCQCFKQ